VDPEAHNPIHAAVESAYPALLAVAMARLHDIDAAEDLAQEVVVRGLLRIDQLRDPARLQAWLIGATRHLAANWQRDESRRERSLRCLAEILPRDNASRPQVRAMIDQQTHQQIIEESLAGMDEADREIVMLHFVAGMPKNRIAETLGVHPATVGRRLEKALEHLKSRALAKLGESLRTDTASPARRQRLRQASLAVLALEGTRQSALAAELDAIEALPASFATTATSSAFESIVAAFSSVPVVIATICVSIVIPIVILVNFPSPLEIQSSANVGQSTIADNSPTGSANAIGLAATSSAEPRRSTRLDEDDIDALLANIPPSEPMRAYIEGRFTDEDGNPVANADIRLHRHSFRLMDEPMYTTRTDANGRYRLDGVVAGIYLFEYKAEDYRINPASTMAVNVGATKLGGRPPRVIEGDGQSGYNGRFYRESQSLHGIVIDAEKELPIGNAQVAFTGLFEGRHVVHASSRTDEEGSFLIENLFPNVEGKVIIRADGYEINASDVLMAVDSPVIIEARQGGQTATVHVSREDNESLNDVTLALYHKDMDLVHVKRPGADGLVTFDALPSGRYSIIAFEARRDRMQALHRQTLDISRYVNTEVQHPTAFHIPQPVSIKGMVRDRDTLEPVSDALAMTIVPYEGQSGHVSAIEPMIGYSTRVDELGRFHITASPIGSHVPQFLVRADTHTYEFIGRASLDSTNEAGNWDIRLGRMPVVHGHVLMPDGTKAPDAMLFAFGHRHGAPTPSWKQEMIPINLDGSFRVSVDGAGLGDDIAVIAHVDREFYGFAALGSRPGTVEYPIDVQLLRGEDAVFVVLDSNGIAIKGSPVAVRLMPPDIDTNFNFLQNIVPTDSDGVSRIPVPTGWKIRATAFDPVDKMDYAIATSESFEPKVDNPFDMQMPGSSVSVRGRVVDSFGSPIQGARIYAPGYGRLESTGSDGTFETKILSGTATLGISADGHWEYGNLSVDRQSADNLVVVLPNATPTTLRVRDSQGNPMRGSVSLQVDAGALTPNFDSLHEYHPYHPSWHELDDNGELQLQLSGHMMYQKSEKAIARIGVIREGVGAGLAEIAPFVIGQQEALTIDIILDERSLSGRIIDANTRKPVTGAVLQTGRHATIASTTTSIDEQRRIRPIDSTDDEGRYHLGMLTGTEKSVYIQHPDYGTRVFDMPTGDHVDFHIDRPVAMEGSVILPRELEVGRWYLSASSTHDGSGRHEFIGTSMGQHPSTEPNRFLLDHVPADEAILTLNLTWARTPDHRSTNLEWHTIAPTNITGTWHHDIHVPPMVEVQTYARRGDVIGANPRMLRYRLTRTTGQDPRVILNPQWSSGDRQDWHFHTLLAPPGEYRVEIQEQIGNDWNTIETGQTILIAEGIDARLMPEEVRARMEGRDK